MANKIFKVKRTDGNDRIMFIGSLRLDMGVNIVTEDEAKALKKNKGYDRVKDLMTVGELKDLDRKKALKVLSEVEVVTAKRKAKELLKEFLTVEDEDESEDDASNSENGDA